VDILILLHLLV